MLKIVFFGRLRELLAIDELSIELRDQQPQSVAQVIENLAAKNSSFSAYIAEGNRLMIAVNQEITDISKQLQSGDELALFPPVTGG